MSGAAGAAAAAAIAARHRLDRMKILLNERETETMDNSILRDAIGKDVQIYLFNEIGSIKGRLMAADGDWIKVQTSKNIQYVNRLTVNYIAVKEQTY